MSQAQKQTSDVPKQPPSSKGSRDFVAKDTDLSLPLAPPEHPVKDPSNASLSKAEPLKNENGEAAKGSPVPVAPPRKKRQQKKEALAKSQVILCVMLKPLAGCPISKDEGVRDIYF